MRKPKSPYRRHGKRPHRYSEALRRWRALVVENRPSAEAAAEHDAYIAKEFGHWPEHGRSRSTTYA